MPGRLGDVDGRVAGGVAAGSDELRGTAVGGGADDLDARAGSGGLDDPLDRRLALEADVHGVVGADAEGRWDGRGRRASRSCPGTRTGPCARFQRARTTSELGEAPSGMRAISSPLPTSSGVGSTRTGWPAASGRCRRRAAGRRGRCADRRRPDAAGGRCGRDRCPWAPSCGRSRRCGRRPTCGPSGSTSAPVEMCRPSATWVEPAAAAASGAAAAKQRASAAKAAARRDECCFGRGTDTTGPILGSASGSDN